MKKKKPAQSRPRNSENHKEAFPTEPFPLEVNLPEWQLPPEEIHTTTGAHAFFIDRPVNTQPGLQGGKGPILQVTNGDGTLKPFAGLHVLASMMYPRDASARKAWLAPMKATYIRYNIERRLHRRLPAQELDRFVASSVHLQEEGGIETLVRAPSLDSIGDQFGECLPGGPLAGQVLLTVLRLTTEKFPSSASINKAVFLLEKQLKKSDNGQGKLLPRSGRRIREAWQRYKPVAHLWIAAEQQPRFPLELHEKERLLTFLAQAEMFRSFGVCLSPHGRAASFLDPDETWKLPPDLVLPHAQIRIDLLTGQEMHILKAYRAPRREL